MRQLSYFIFTSGEEGVHGLDWGIKFASSVLGDHNQLDTSYRDLLREFNLSPNLERPQNSVGLLLLKWTMNLLVFVFPGEDLYGRQNTIAIACNVPVDIVRDKSVREVARRIWSANDLAGIAQRGGFRPDVIVFPDEAAPSIEYPFVTSSILMKWPSDELGYFSINRNIRELHRHSVKVEEPVIVPPKPRAKLLVIIAACVIVGVVGIFALLPPKNIEPEIKPKEIESVDNVPEISLDVPEIMPTLASSDDTSNDIILTDNVREDLYDLLKPLRSERSEVKLAEAKLKLDSIPRIAGEKLYVAFRNGQYGSIRKDIFDELERKLTIESRNDSIRRIEITFDSDDRLRAMNGDISFDLCVEIFVDQLLKEGELR